MLCSLILALKKIDDDIIFSYTDIIAFFRSKFLKKHLKFNYQYKLISLNIFKPILGTDYLKNFKNICETKIPRNQLLDINKSNLEKKYINQTA